MKSLLLGDCLEVLKNYPDNHFDSCITDPPYGMGMDEWETSREFVEVFGCSIRGAIVHNDQFVLQVPFIAQETGATQLRVGYPVVGYEDNAGARMLHCLSAKRGRGGKAPGNRQGFLRNSSGPA